MNLYWLVELDDNSTAFRTLAVVGEAGERRSYRLLTGATKDPAPDTSPDEDTVMLVDLDVIVPWKGHRLGLVPVASPPPTDDLDEALEHLAARIAATLRQAS